MAYTQAFNELANASIFKAVDTMYFGILSYWWIMILFVFTLFSVQIATKEEGATAVVALAGSAFLLKYAPTGVPVTVHAILYLIMAISFAMLLYKVFGGKD